MRRRSLDREILDGQMEDPALLADSMREVWVVNRALGSLRLLRRYLHRWIAVHSSRGTLSLLDVAGGTGDVACALVRWAGSHGVVLRVTLADNHPQVLNTARSRTATMPGVQVVHADAAVLPYPDGHFDVAICNLALHHFAEAEAIGVLQEMDRVSRLGWVVIDLERSRLAYAGARLLSATVWQSPITRHDGPLSVRRAYRAAEARALVAAAGLQAQVTRHFPCWLSLVSSPP